MSIQKQTSNTDAFSSWAAVTLMVTLTISISLLFPVPIDAESSAPAFSSLKSKTGLRLRVQKSDQITFIHAQLIIYYGKNIKNPAIPYLTLLNIFDRNLRGQDTTLLNILKRLGNDFEVENRPDFLLFKINFLPEKIQLFMRFLRTLYNYKPFLELNAPSSYVDERQKINTETRFKDSIRNYWNYFFRRKDWKTRIAYQIAYHHWFSSAAMGQTLITPKSLNNITLDQLRSFYENTYQLPNSLLIIKGNIPPIFLGLIERAFASSKKQPPRKPVVEKLTFASENKIIIFDVKNDDAPTMFWFEAVPASNGGNPLASLVLNNILFTYPTGRLYLNSRSSKINILGMQTQMVNHQELSIICNTIRLRYIDFRKFIVLVEKERKKIQAQQVNKREYLNTLSNIIGRLEVNTQDFENDVGLEIIKTEYYDAKKVTLASLNKTNENSNHEVIVIIGNAQLILPQLGIFQSRAKVIDFIR